jgi:Tfp pilus assembly protein PilF
MKICRGLLLIMLAFLAGACTARADAIDDQYVRIYNLIQEGDALSGGGQPSEAIARYKEAQHDLLRFQRMYPAWNTKVVAFRLNYLSSRVPDSAATAAPAASPRPQPLGSPSANAIPTNKPAPPAVASQPGSAAPVRSASPTQPVVAQPSEADVTSLKDQLRQLQADKLLLEAKLKEALTAMPAATDPREIAKAEERLKALLKENDLLKVDLDLVKSRANKSGADPAALQKAQKDLAEANRRLSEQTEKANLLTVEKNALQAKLKTTEPNAWNAAALDATRKALEEANRQIVTQREAANKLAAEKATLQARLNSMTAGTDAATALRAENQLLKKQLADLRSSKGAAPGTGPAAGGSKQLTEAQAQIAALRSDREILRLEKLALEDRLKRLSSKMPSSGVLASTSGSKAGDEAARIQQLERERDDLQAKLEAATKKLNNPSVNQGDLARVQDLENQLGVLRARLEVFEARQVPYTPEELALFKKPDATIAADDPNNGKKSVRELPPGSAILVAEADRYFSTKQYDKAEDRYLQVLRKDERNVPTLANLAAIQLEMNHLDEAEKHIRQAVAISPEDAYSLSIMGYLKFRQNKFDDALAALSKAAKLDPQNAQIQNYLGITLSQKGMRAAAETALRKAIQLEPGYGSAHHNLAVIYATQKPPLIELARWHYQKALHAGHPRNAQLEQLFDAGKGPDDHSVPKTASSGAGQ